MNVIPVGRTIAQVQCYDENGKPLGSNDTPDNYHGNTHQHDTKLKLFAEGSMDKLEHNNYITEFFLSDIPSEMILLNKVYITGKNGLKGKVTEISALTAGVEVEIWLTIHWVNSRVDPTYIKLEDSNMLKVDVAAYGHMLRPYIDFKLNQLKRAQQFLERVAVN